MSANATTPETPVAATVRCAVITVSDTRSAGDDPGGQAAADLLGDGGQQVVTRDIVPMDPKLVADCVTKLAGRGDIDAIFVLGGTGLHRRDQVYETLYRLFDKRLPGFGELFRFLAFQEIGPMAMACRALGGVVGRAIVFTMPGPVQAVELCMRKLVLPQLAAIVHEVQQ